MIQELEVSLKIARIEYNQKKTISEYLEHAFSIAEYEKAQAYIELEEAFDKLENAKKGGVEWKKKFLS